MTGKIIEKDKKKSEHCSYCSLIFCCTFAVWGVPICYINVIKALTQVEQPGRFRISSHLTVIQLQNQGKDNTYDLSLLLYFCCWLTASVGWIFSFWKLRPSIIVKAAAVNLCTFLSFSLSQSEVKQVKCSAVKTIRSGKITVIVLKIISVMGYGDIYKDIRHLKWD